VAYPGPPRASTDGRTATSHRPSTTISSTKVLIKAITRWHQDTLSGRRSKALGIRAADHDNPRFVERQLGMRPPSAPWAWAGRCGSMGMEVTR